MGFINRAPPTHSLVPGVNFTVTGTEDLVRKLAILERGMRAEIVNPALEAGALVVAHAVQAETPRETGQLASAIIVKQLGVKKGVLAYSVQIGRDGFFLGKSWYGGPVHYGHSTASRKLRRHRAAEHNVTLKAESAVLQQRSKRTAKARQSATWNPFDWLKQRQKGKAQARAKLALKEAKKSERRRLSSIAKNITELEFGARRVPANPFMRRGFDKSQARAVTVTLETMRQGIERLALRK